MSPWSESGENKKVNESEEDKAEFLREQSKVARAGRPSGTVGCGTANNWKGRLYCPKVKAIAEEMDIEHFQGGPSWCFCFMRRQHLFIRARTAVVQRLPTDYQERAAIFRTYCHDKITTPSHIYEAAAGKLCHLMQVDCSRMDYDTVFMYWKSFHKINAKPEPDTDDPTVDLELRTIVLPNRCTQPGKGWKDPHANLKILSMSEQESLTFTDPTYGRTFKTFKETFIARCHQYNGSDCETIWSTFEQAYVGRDPCKIPTDAYNPLFQVAPITMTCGKTMFWSKTKDVVHAYNDNTKCFVTMEDTLLGSVLDNLSWCGKEGSNETFTSGCPDWNTCEDNPVRSFWTQGSAKWIVNAWASTVVRAFGKAGIVTEMPDNTSDTDPDDDFDETEPAMLDAVFAQLFNSDTEEEEFEGFLDEE
ncbi:ADP-ribosyl cyclase/cyclic ADP-ribose hydrolase 1 [Takifugu flavidus]|uniref:ADP-ribosyl cyclase/cyclic ADP-ribose hydrolase n=1 Tax=Takifugu flavidus TaxID=433684 RepID=A0A5C6NUV3_9TELE|nr:ADP-ribosyl cyclase/cyclic ADP-ribose hydrolase 1 [Takifugu flavidus]